MKKNNFTYKKTLVSILVIGIFLPQMVFAAWWNPFSWFTNWSFSEPKENEVEVLKGEVDELKEKLENDEINLSEENSTMDNEGLEGVQTKNIETEETIKEQTQIIEQQKKVIESNQNEIEKLELQRKIEDVLNQQTQNNALRLSNDNDDVLQRVEKIEETLINENILYRFEPSIVLDDDTIKNNGSDYVNFEIISKDSAGEIIPNKELYITITVTGNTKGSEVLVEEEEETDSNGYLEYRTPTTKISDRCGAYMQISVKDDKGNGGGKSIKIEETGDIEEVKSGSRIPFSACP